MICRFIVSHNTCNDSLYLFFFVPAKSERISFNPIQLNPIQLSPIEFSPVTSSWPDSWNPFFRMFSSPRAGKYLLTLLYPIIDCVFILNQSIKADFMTPSPPLLLDSSKTFPSSCYGCLFTYLFIFFLGSVVVFPEFIIWGPVRNLWCSFRHFFSVQNSSAFVVFRCEPRLKPVPTFSQLVDEDHKGSLTTRWIQQCTI